MASLMDLINAKKQQIDASKRSNAKRLPDGRSRIRILPSWRTGDETFWHDFGQHFIKSPSASGTSTVAAIYMCVDKTFGRPCDVCKAIKEAAASTSDDVTLNIIKEANASSRVLVNALHIDGQTPTVPDVFELPPTVFEQIIGIMQLYQQDGVSIVDLATGFDLSIERQGKGLSTKYTVSTVPKSTVVSPDVMSKIQDLDKYVAQENESNKHRAISEVRSVAGLLSSSPSPQLGNLLDVDEDLTQQIPTSAPAISAPKPSVAPVPQDVEFEDTPPFEVATAKVAATVAIAKASLPDEPASAGTGDAELDDLLAELNVGDE